ncbi:large ribosomal subunit protein uL23m-like [Littorina saxatilis]|uniref:Large ribosomal subunit protein uL23m n=1 Tax=Littorina saxatilis TaxID=31220 RepID=A0AAN9BPF9_9CAEN
MASSLKDLRGLRLLPLWRRRVPRYPVYMNGDPQLRLTMPHFWMKMVRPEKEIPENQVQFIVHPQMSVIDVKNYLEKVYKVPVLDVRTKVFAGKDITQQARGHVLAKEEDHKKAYVQLADGESFEFPDLFEENKPATEKQAKEVKKQERTGLEDQRKHWDRLTIPTWFR